jgi:YQGE family putative transporter
MSLINPAQTFFKEIKFFNGLNKNAIKLLISNLSFEIASPMIYIFSNSFFWYKTLDIQLILLFNLFFYLLIPLSFFLNAYLLKRVNIKYIAFSGLVLQGFSLLFFIFNVNPNYLNTILFGTLLGLFSGLYWANRNFMEFQTTKDENRDYYYGTLLSGATLISILFNAIYGNFLGHPEIWDVSKDTLYLIAAIFVIIVLTISGSFLIKGKFRNPIVKAVILKNPNEKWKRFRKIYFLTGLREANSFLIPTLLILYVLQTEDLLGEANSLASIASAVVIYLVGRYIRKQDRKIVIALGTLLLAINSFLLIIFYSDHFAFIYNTIESIGNIFIYLSLVPMFLNQLDIQKESSDSEYKFLFDADLFLNIGRIAGTVLIFFIFNLFGNEAGIKLTPLLFVVFNLFFLRNVYLVKE